jgi:DNA-binding IclR family transcriptional regulator
MNASPVRQRLARIMEEVRDQTGLTTQAGFLDGTHVVIALSEEGTDLVKASATLGARLPVHATAIGKAVLAQLSNEGIDGILGAGLPALTKRTATTQKRVRQEIEAVRARGLATAESELEDGLDAIAVALPPAVFGVPAGLGCSGPSASVVQRRDAVEAALRAAATDIRLA